MTLLELLRDVANLGDEKTIIAAKPWTPASLAQLVTEPEGGGPASLMERDGMTYFLEVAIVQELKEGLTELDAGAFCERVILYATNDA